MDRGTRTRIVFGSVQADVALVKTSGSPREAKHDVRRGDAPSPAQAKRDARALAGADSPDGDLTAMFEGGADPLTGEPARPAATDVAASARGGELTDAELAEEDDAAPVRHGVWRGEEWVDLTEDLAEIDRRAKIDGLVVECTVASSSVPRERVRDARWIAAADPRASRVLALVLHGLREGDMAAVVRWTKSKNQALGLLVPRRVGTGWALVLLELEWSANMRPPDHRVTGPHELSVTDRERAAAARLVDSYSEPASALEAVRDERTAQRAELLAAARSGKAWRPSQPGGDDARHRAGKAAADALAAAG